ncbi:LysM peptidoglycan-binding domain-containing protein [Tolypothrix campylonemoides VB511288]|nr:LysM peptidoglycan-binding domain-containing protein [Tolypothrix campylonemoides VB511288]
MFYTVESGDTLPRIAEKFYGDRTCWQTIYDANQDVIVLIPGVELFIPLDLCSEFQREWQIIVV